MAEYPQVGERYRLKEDVDRYPNFMLAAGATGTVVRVTRSPYSMICVRMDEHVEGAEEWDNELQLVDEDAIHLGEGHDASDAFAEIAERID